MEIPVLKGDFTKLRSVLYGCHPAELYPHLGVIITNITRPAETAVMFYNHRATAEQRIKRGKNAVTWTRLSCHSFKANAARLQLHALAYNLAYFLRTLTLPQEVEWWSPATLRDRFVKISPQDSPPRPLGDFPDG